MEDEKGISGMWRGLESSSEGPVGGEKGGFTAKKDNQTRLCPLQGRRIVKDSRITTGGPPLGPAAIFYKICNWARGLTATYNHL